MLEVELFTLHLTTRGPNEGGNSTQTQEQKIFQMPHDARSLLERMRRLAIEGGKEAMVHYGNITEVMTKSDQSPLTAADLAVDRIIVSGLERAFPDIPIITEERSHNHEDNFTDALFFLVDPIDGTKEFINKRNEFTINIALLEKGEPIAGAVCAPALQRVFWGGKSLGAHESADEIEAPRREIKIREADNDAIAIVASRSHQTAETSAFIDANKVGELKNAGSSLKFCLLACGEADLYPRFGPTMEWDTAAGHAVLSAAGGFVENIDQSPLQYGKPEYRNPWFIARTPTVQFVQPQV